MHLAHELGLSPDEQPSPRVAALASLASFSVGAIIPVLPFLLGFGTLWWGLLAGAAGLLAAGFAAASSPTATRSRALASNCSSAASPWQRLRHRQAARGVCTRVNGATALAQRTLGRSSPQSRRLNACPAQSSLMRCLTSFDAFHPVA